MNDFLQVCLYFLTFLQCLCDECFCLSFFSNGHRWVAEPHLQSKVRCWPQAATYSPNGAPAPGQFADSSDCCLGNTPETPECSFLRTRKKHVPYPGRQRYPTYSDRNLMGKMAREGRSPGPGPQHPRGYSSL